MTNMRPNFTVEEENEALIGILRANYDDAIEQIQALKADVNELVNLLLQHSVEIPTGILERMHLDNPLE